MVDITDGGKMQIDDLTSGLDLQEVSGLDFFHIGSLKVKLLNME